MNDHYHDRAYWIIEQDCISDKFDIHVQSEVYSQQEE